MSLENLDIKNQISKKAAPVVAAVLLHPHTSEFLALPTVNDAKDFVNGIRNLSIAGIREFAYEIKKRGDEVGWKNVGVRVGSLGLLTLTAACNLQAVGNETPTAPYLLGTVDNPTYLPSSTATITNTPTLFPSRTPIVVAQGPSVTPDMEGTVGALQAQINAQSTESSSLRAALTALVPATLLPSFTPSLTNTATLTVTPSMTSTPDRQIQLDPGPWRGEFRDNLVTPDLGGVTRWQFILEQTAQDMDRVAADPSIYPQIAGDTSLFSSLAGKFRPADEFNQLPSQEAGFEQTRADVMQYQYVDSVIDSAGDIFVQQLGHLNPDTGLYTTGFIGHDFGDVTFLSALYYVSLRQPDLFVNGDGTAMTVSEALSPTNPNYDSVASQTLSWQSAFQREFIDVTLPVSDQEAARRANPASGDVSRELLQPQPSNQGESCVVYRVVDIDQQALDQSGADVNTRTEERRDDPQSVRRVRFTERPLSDESTFQEVNLSDTMFLGVFGVSENNIENWDFDMFEDGTHTNPRDAWERESRTADELVLCGQPGDLGDVPAPDTAVPPPTSTSRPFVPPANTRPPQGPTQPANTPPPGNTPPPPLVTEAATQPPQVFITPGGDGGATDIPEQNTAIPAETPVNPPAQPTPAPVEPTSETGD